MSYWVYMVRCSDNSYYIGITNELERRLAEHEHGLNKKCYTYKRRPTQLVYSAEFREVNQAIEFEKRIKKWRRAKKEALISGEYELLVTLSRRYGSTPPLAGSP